MLKLEKASSISDANKLFLFLSKLLKSYLNEFTLDISYGLGALIICSKEI